jgi:hypothetical protein|tara:strand:+ start:531 stop:971 length:441 start_codon:yes stop_codon:yes gene_type:complete
MIRKRLKFSDYYNELIVDEICQIYDVEKERIFLRNRKRNIIHAKRLYIYILREMFDMTLKNIGKITNLHHASIIHHHEQFKFEYQTYEIEKQNFERVESKIIEVELDEEIRDSEEQLKTINNTLTKLYKINKLKNERQERESLLTQ